MPYFLVSINDEKETEYVCLEADTPLKAVRAVEIDDKKYAGKTHVEVRCWLMNHLMERSSAIHRMMKQPEKYYKSLAVAHMVFPGVWTSAEDDD